jgi:hypothetical protein
MTQLEASASHAGAHVSVVGGEGIVCILGATEASNDVPGFAVRLGTELVGVITELAADFESIIARVGVATGKSPERDTKGVCTPTVRDEAVDRARRLALSAPAGRVMVAQGTQRLTGRQLRYARELQTLADHWNVPFAASEVAGFGAPPPAGEVYGRENELAGIRYVVESAARRRAGGVVLIGDSGVGKTTLLSEAERVARWKGMVVARAACGRITLPVPYDAVRQLVRSAAVEVTVRLGDQDDDLSGKSAVKAAVELLNLSRADGRRVEILAGNRRGERGTPIAKRRMLVRLGFFAFLRAIAEQVGVCFVFDDVDRIDEESLELISVALERMPDVRVACLATSTRMPSAGVFSALPPVKLPALDRNAISRIVHKAADGHAVPAGSLT